MSSLFGSSEPSQEEMLDKQAEQNLNQQAHGATLADNDGFDREEYLQNLVEHGMDPGTAKLLHNLLTPNFVLSKLSDAEKGELRWLARIVVKETEWMHPPPDSVVTGERRQFLLADPADSLRPLNERQRGLLEQALMTIFARIARSHRGWQQDKLNESISVARTETEDDGSDGGLFQI